ncbi:MAG TPA: DUF6111 family protein [Acetobacteraceae bacterium]|nr:DUF6111 family protein [Acetobacteraceae bacterium]
MLRLSELALFLSPFLLFAAWRFALARGLRSGPVVATAAGALVLMIGVLMWFAADRALPRNGAYVPARLEDGRIVPGHAAAGSTD